MWFWQVGCASCRKGHPGFHVTSRPHLLTNRSVYSGPGQASAPFTKGWILAAPVSCPLGSVHFHQPSTQRNLILQCKWQQILEYPELSESRFRLHPASLSPIRRFSFSRMGLLYFREFLPPLILSGWAWMIYPAEVINLDCSLWRKQFVKPTSSD